MASVSKAQLREIAKNDLGHSVSHVNSALSGQGLSALKPVLQRVGRGNQLPHWFDQLEKYGTLPNLDGKTIGSVIEMLYLAVLETDTLASTGVGQLTVNPARGVDLPDLDLGVKSPSENYCTSEPFFSPYERLVGSEYDAVVLLTDYQSAKANPPLRLQIKKYSYLNNTQIADSALCALARKHREWLLKENESWAKKVFRFLAFVNQSDWRAARLLKLVDKLNEDSSGISKLVRSFVKDFDTKNKQRARKGKELIPQTEVDALSALTEVRPTLLGIIDAVDNWVVEAHKDFGRLPNDNEWQRLCTGPLDGKIGMSYALQWRYNFVKLLA